MKMNLLAAASLVLTLGSAGMVMKPTNAIAGSWIKCTHEGGHCKPTSVRSRGAINVRYGIGNKWRYTRNGNAVWCTNQQFGDPAPGRRKICQAYFPSWVKCTHEGGHCKGAAQGLIRYGTSPHKRSKYKQLGVVRNGSAWCTNQVFGDPVPGKRKSCWVYK